VPRGHPLNPVRVECDEGVILVTGAAGKQPPDGPDVYTMSIRPSLVTLETDLQYIFASRMTYSTRRTGVARFTSHGAHIDGTLSTHQVWTEVEADGRISHHSLDYAVRVKGDVTCGAYGRM
jgi:hypothetical protein